MHQRESDEHRDPLRPKAARIEDELSGQFGQAAAAGRTEALGADGIIGLQRAVGNAGVAAMLEEERSPVHDVVRSGGRPLEPDVRGDMETRLGHDFSDVRVHDDSAAQASATAVNAHAYTVGPNIVFQRDRYDPSSTEGKTTLAHELTHVIQQRSGPVEGTSAPGGIKVSDPSDRFEQEATHNAERVMSGLPAVPTAVSAGGPAVQREEDEDAQVQALFVQRAEGAEEEPEEPVQGSFVQRAEGDTEEPEEAEA